MSHLQPTHSDLVEVAAAWLRKRCAIVVTEIATSGEEPDALGWQGPHSTLIECKVSRGDFLADRQKPFRRQAERGIGRSRYFLTPSGLIDATELPQGWGLLEYDGKRVCCAKKSEYFENVNDRHEITILLSLLRRIGRTAPTGTSIKFYTFETRNTATLGMEKEESPLTAEERRAG